MIKQLIPRMTEICGPDGVITDPAELRTYECDGLTSHRVTPALVVLPRTAQEVALADDYAEFLTLPAYERMP